MSMGDLSAAAAAAPAGKAARRTKKGWKKPADKPKRPLSAYNLFFRDERERILSEKKTSAVKKKEARDEDAAEDSNSNCKDSGKDKDQEEAAALECDEDGQEKKPRKHRRSHGKIGFAALARNIAEKWKTMIPAERAPFEARAAFEKVRYAKALADWEERKRLTSGHVEEPAPVPMRLEDMFAMHQPALATNEDNDNHHHNHNAHHNHNDNDDHNDDDKQEQPLQSTEKVSEPKRQPRSKPKKRPAPSSQHLRNKIKKKKSETLDMKARLFLTSIKKPDDNNSDQNHDDNHDTHDNHSNASDIDEEQQPPPQDITTQQSYETFPAKQDEWTAHNNQNWSAHHPSKHTQHKHHTDSTWVQGINTHQQQQQQQLQPQPHPNTIPNPDETSKISEDEPVVVAEPKPTTDNNTPTTKATTTTKATSNTTNPLGKGFAVEATLDKKAKSFLTTILHQYSSGPLR